MSIKTIDVFLNQFDMKLNVGRLAHKDKTIYFEYSKDFLDTGLEISPYKLPLKSGVFVCEDKIFEGLYGVFGDSLPDGWGKLLLDRHFLKQGVSYNDITPLDRLSNIGKYGTGALSYEPVIENIVLQSENISLDKLAQSSQEILQGSSDDMLEELLLLGGSSAGARPKAMIQLNDEDKIIHGSQSLHCGFAHWMVKFASGSDSSDIGSVEYAYSLMAKDAKIDMSNTKLLRGTNNSYFAVKRFDRIGDNRVHLHSVAGLTHSDFRFPTLDYDDLLTLTLHLTKDINEQIKMFRLACFNLFAHNRDDHAKNFSFLMDGEGRWRLSPAYDLTFSYGPGGEHSTTYLGEGKNPTSEHLLKLAKKHNIKNAKEIVDEIKSVVNDFATYANIAGVSKHSIEIILKEIQNR